MKKVISEVYVKLRKEISLNVEDDIDRIPTLSAFYAKEVVERIKMGVSNTFGSELIDYEIKKITFIDNKEGE